MPTTSAARGSCTRWLGGWATKTTGITTERPRAIGKFLFVGTEKLYVRGVTYGTFRPDAAGAEYPPSERVESDFALMTASGVNAVRTYTPPPTWLLDAAWRHGLRVMVGLPVERQAAFFDDRGCARAIEHMVRTAVRAHAGHPAVLCWVIGNEIPASIVRWHGRHRVERFLERLYRAVKKLDPDGLVTYVNYPSTEYLQLPFLDLVAFNVYLESKARFEAYLARLHNVAAERPLLMAEIGMDSLRNGEFQQATLLHWQLRSAFSGGCAGAFVYSWTDEWFRGGGPVKDWKFGITDEERNAKPALAAVQGAFTDVPFPANGAWPRISVVVCSYNGARTIRECCVGVSQLAYPNHEVIVVDDGSTDGTGAIAAEYGFRVIRTPNRGLSSARNTGMHAATGQIVAYLDDDAYPDPHWLHYLAAVFRDPANASVAGAGGPNLLPANDGLVAECVSRAPGGPTHVLISDQTAEHIPGCNMAFRRRCLLEIDGFDARFRVAGDDVDLCWRLQERGYTLHFSPAAVVYHHRRNSVRAYLRQQRGYGRAEAMLERKWPQKYNAAGHATWAGRVYDSTVLSRYFRSGRIYHGVWGLAPYQMLYERAPSLWASLPLMPEWYLVLGGLALLSVLGTLWWPLRVSGLLLAAAAAAPVVQAASCAARIPLQNAARSRRYAVKLLTTYLHLLQPLARLYGRLSSGLTLWRRGGGRSWLVPRRWTADIWTRRPREVAEHLAGIEAGLRGDGHVPIRGSDYDRWDLEVAGGLLGSARLSLAAEHHGDGRQLLRIRCWPRFPFAALALASILATGSAAALSDQSWPAGLVLGGIAALVAGRAVRESSCSVTAFLPPVRQMHDKEGDGVPLRAQPATVAPARLAPIRTPDEVGG